MSTSDEVPDTESHGTSGGVELTDELIERLASEADAVTDLTGWVHRSRPVNRLVVNETPDDVYDDAWSVVGNPRVEPHVLVVGSSTDGHVRVGVVTRSGDAATVSPVPGDEAPGDAWVSLRDAREVERLITALDDASQRAFSRAVPTPGELVERAVDVLARLRDVVTATRDAVRVASPSEESGTELRRRLGTDPREWAAEFVRTFGGETVGERPDEDTLTGWFANALDAGGPRPLG